MSLPQFAYCKVAISPVRSTHQDSAEMVTQLLFGELVELKELVSNWCKITVFSDNYEGWVDIKQLGFLSPKEMKKWFDNSSMTPKLISQLSSSNGNFWITKGSYVAQDETNQFSIGADKYQLIDTQSNNHSEFNTISAFALSYLNTPYLWGGKSPFGIDCSGFTQLVFRYFNHNLPRDAYQQAELGSKIDFTDCKPGDLAFFTNISGKIIHVGIVLENNKIIHASGYVRIDTLTSSGILNEDKKELTHSLFSIQRI